MYNPIWRPIPGTGQNLSIGASSVASTAVGSQTYAVRLSATGNCYVAIGQSPTASSAGMLIKSTDIPLDVGVSPSDKVAVIQVGSSTGTLNLVELTH